MSIRIVWPETLLLSHAVIEAWFVEELEKGTIPPHEVNARTPEAMAEALHNAGRIRLASKQVY